MPPNEKCKDKRNVFFPWSTEDLITAWSQFFPADRPPPQTRQEICNEMHKNTELYKTLLKVKSFTKAKEEHQETLKEKKHQKQQLLLSKQSKAEERKVAKELKEQRKIVKLKEQKEPERKLLNIWEEYDLMPFSETTKAEIKLVEKEKGLKYVYETFVDRIVPKRKLSDPLSSTFPTLEFPWSNVQLGMPRDEAVEKFNTDQAYRELILRQVPAYNFAHPDREFINLNICLHNYTIFVPWNPAHIKHFLDVLIAEEKVVTDAEIRAQLLRHWNNEVLRKYVSNMAVVPTSKLEIIQMANLSTLLLAFLAFQPRELTDEQVQNLWANEILVQSYEMHKLSSGTLNFKDMLSDISSYKLFDTNVGTYLFNERDILQLKVRNIAFKASKQKFAFVKEQAARLLDVINEESARGPLLRLKGILQGTRFFLNALFVCDKEFRQQIPTSQMVLRQTAPPMLADTAKRFQKYIDETWSQYRLPAVDEFPPKSDCEEKKVSKNHFIEPDNTQRFMNEEFTPSSFENGRIIVHSVGSGKTCLAIRIASDFSRAGFRIVWVTKHSLRNQVLKNHVSEICNLLIRDEYVRIQTFSGHQAADTWLQSLPKQTSFQGVISTLKSLGMEWYNMSYRQFSNAINQNNETGRKWKAQSEKDLLSKTLVIIDEAHKLFTGELDRTELPDVAAMHKAFQHSYRKSMQNRCRVLFMTATPTTTSVLPLLSMLNMLHQTNVFDHSMHTLDPTREDWAEHVQKVREQNRKEELAVACELFPKKCRKQAEEDEDEDNAQAYFDSKTITGATVFKPNELTNHLQEFWSNAYGLISYYDISADYSKFPRTEYARIILPSATLFQEQRMAAELVNAKKSLAHRSKRIRQIAAWAKFESVDSESHKPLSMDLEIMGENKKSTFFEPTHEDLIARRAQLLEAIRQERESKPSVPDDYEKYKSDLKETNSKIEEETQKVHGSRTSAEMGQHTKLLKKLRGRADGLEAAIREIESKIEFQETIKNVKVQFFEKRLARVDRKIEKMEKLHGSGKRHISKRVLITTEEKEDEEEEEEEEEDEEENRKKPKKQPRKRRNESEDDEDTEDESVVVDLQTEKAEASLKGKDFVMEKKWVIVKGALPNTQPKHPKCHYFDQPRTFDAERFRKDIPLYSPKLEKLLEILESDDNHCRKQNPEENVNHRHRKRLVFCQDIHDIRAVAGGLMAHGWTFGMKRRFVKWQKTYSDIESGKVLKQIESKDPQLTWLPSTDDGEDYKRFLVLTKSKIGGVSGASLNEYSVQTIGAKGGEATYNHTDNLYGKNYRIILIDRNFMEGIDLPSTYADLFDSVLSASDRTQIVGRISRFCGNSGLQFMPDYGWPQRVYRYDLKFHTLGLHMSERQLENFNREVHQPDSQYRDLFPEKYADAFVTKIESNLFSPTELQILLDGNMEMQRIQKKTLDIYNALMEKVSIGMLLYAPAMRNLAKSRHELDDLLMDEEETADEYRHEAIMAQRGQTDVKYELRSIARLRERFKTHDGVLIQMLDHHVKRILFKKSDKDTISQWKDPKRVESYFDRNIAPEMQTAELITTSKDHALNVFTTMLNERLGNKAEQLESVRRRQVEKEEMKLDKDAKRLIRKAADSGTPIRKMKNEVLWERVQSKMSRERFDRVWIALQKPRKLASRRQSSKKPDGSKKPDSSRKPSSRGQTVRKSLMDRRNLRKNQIVRENQTVQKSPRLKRSKNSSQSRRKFYTCLTR
jgi:hypothetical protein